MAACRVQQPSSKGAGLATSLLLGPQSPQENQGLDEHEHKAAAGPILIFSTHLSHWFLLRVLGLDHDLSFTLLFSINSNNLQIMITCLQFWGSGGTTFRFTIYFGEFRVSQTSFLLSSEQQNTFSCLPPQHCCWIKTKKELV